MRTHPHPRSASSTSLIATAITAALVVFTLSSAQAQAPSPDALRGADARQAMDLANAWKGQPVTSFVTPHAVHFEFPDGVTVEVALPEDEMLVSVAPYLVNTHPCATHFMSGCQGELVGVPFHVRAVLADGTVVIDEVMATMENGFIDLWLPRSEDIELSFESEGGDYRTIGVVGTHDDSWTCITTLQLAQVDP